MYRKPSEPSQTASSSRSWDGSLVLRDREGEPPIVLPQETDGPNTAPGSAGRSSSGSGYFAQTPPYGAPSERAPRVAMNEHRKEMPALIQVPTRSASKSPPVAAFHQPPTRVAGGPTEAAQPPEMAPSFQQEVQPPLPELSTTTNRQPVGKESPMEPLRSETSGAEESHDDDTIEAMDEESDRRTYTLRDGDTLAKLAKRHLGSADRANEIYQLNRDRLTNADLLPVGVEIELPPRRLRVRKDAAEVAPKLVSTDSVEAVEQHEPPQHEPPKSTVWQAVPTKAPTKAITRPTPPTYAPKLVPIAD